MVYGERLSQRIRELAGDNKMVQIFLLANTVDILARVSAVDDTKYFEIVKKNIEVHLKENLPDGDIPADYWNIERMKRLTEKVEVK